MNTTHKVSIGGMAFIVDENAYGELKSYTDRLHTQFSHRAEGQEIVADIESRIAELLNSKLLSPEQVVSLADVKDVISTIGDPSELDEGAEKVGEQPSYSPSSSHTSRRLYRSADSKVIAGVCGGLGAYFNVDPVLFRIAFVGLTIIGSPIAIGWFFPIVYIILWISAPMAITVGQKLEMEGKKVNMSTIEQRIREEASNMSPHIRTAGESFLRVVGVFIKVVGLFFASIFVVVGLALSTALLVSFFGVDPSIMSNFVSINNDTDFALFNVVYSFFPHLFWFKVSLFALTIIPTILMIILMIKLLFKSRFHTRYVVIPLTAIWVIALFVSLFTGVVSLKNSFGGNSQVNDTVYAQAPIDTLTIAYNGEVQLNPNDMLITLRSCNSNDCDDINVSVNGKDIVNFDKHGHDWRHHEGFSIVSTNNTQNAKLDANSIVYVRPMVSVEYDENIDKPQVLVKKWATGSNNSQAMQTAEEIKFTAIFKGDSLLITPATPLKLSDRILKWVDITVLIPKGKAYKVGKDMHTSLNNHDSKRVNGVYVYDESNSSTFDENDVEDVDTVVVKATDKI
jgi:phage shock protein PspC (stress-responsive transcriptional regulator)